MAATDKRTYLDLRATLSDNRLLGLWRLATGYRLPYLWATLSLAVATIAKTTTYLLLAYFVDHVLGRIGARPFWLGWRRALWAWRRWRADQAC